MQRVISWTESASIAAGFIMKRHHAEIRDASSMLYTIPYSAFPFSAFHLSSDSHYIFATKDIPLVNSSTHTHCGGTKMVNIRMKVVCCRLKTFLYTIGTSRYCTPFSFSAARVNPTQGSAFLTNCKINNKGRSRMESVRV